MKITLTDKEMIRIINEKFATLMFEDYRIDEIIKRYSDDWEIRITKIIPESETGEEVADGD